MEVAVQVAQRWILAQLRNRRFFSLAWLNAAIRLLRDEAAATAILAKVIKRNGWPEKVVIDKSGANLAGLRNMNLPLVMHGCYLLIEVLQVKYLNNIIEQDHRFIKKLTRPMLGFKALHSAQATIAWIEAAHMIRKAQIANENRNPFQIFAELAG